VADFTLTDGDPFIAKPKDIAKIKAVGTFVSGNEIAIQ
jgi:predicted amidohydrolase YtcJ